MNQKSQGKQLSLMTLMQIVLVCGALLGYFFASTSQFSKQVITFEQLPPDDEDAKKWLATNSNMRNVVITRNDSELTIAGSRSLWAWLNEANPEPPWREFGYREPQYIESQAATRFPLWPAIGLVLILVALRFVANYFTRKRNESTGGPSSTTVAPPG
jgi:hypothetical protein